MKLASFFLLMVLALHVSAQISTQDEKRFFTLKYEKYKKVKKVGILMTVAGAVVFGDVHARAAPPNSSDELVRILVAEGLMGSGIVLTIVGTKRMKQYRAKMEGISPNINVQRYYKYRKMQDAGFGMVVSGVLLGALGISKLQNLPAGYIYRTPNTPVGALMVLGGVGLLGTGIPLSIRGTRKMHQYQQKIDNNSLSLSLSSEMYGLTLSYRF